MVDSATDRAEAAAATGSAPPRATDPALGTARSPRSSRSAGSDWPTVPAAGSGRPRDRKWSAAIQARTSAR